MHPFPILLSALLWAAADCSESHHIPSVVRLVFRNDSGPATAPPPDRPLPGSGALRGSDLPLVYCMDSKYPEDVYCDVGMLQKDDVYPDKMVAQGASTAIADPVRPGKFCKLSFNNPIEGSADPFRFQEIMCGIDREIISESSLTVPKGIDSMVVLPQFKVASMSDFVLMSYYSGIGCFHRLKRHRSVAKQRVRGSLFKLDSFFCSIGFGVAEGRPNARYPDQILYKHDGKRWRPVGIWPDFL